MRCKCPKNPSALHIFDGGPGGICTRTCVEVMVRAENLHAFLFLEINQVLACETYGDFISGDASMSFFMP
jgi:hypothetical protein